MNTQKKIIFALAILILLGGVAYAATKLYPQYVAQKEKKQQELCAVDISAVVMPDPEKTLKTDEEIVRAVFNHYFEEYTKIPDCEVAGITGYKLISIGTIDRTDADHFIAPIVFELEPISLEKTAWKNNDNNIEGSWIKNMKGTLSIRKSDEGYFLII